MMVLASIKRNLLPWTPPAVLDWYLGRRPLYTGDFASWESATAAAGSYDEPVIFEKVRTSAAMVRDGKAVYERDGVTFDHIEHAPGLLAGLLHAAATHEGRLSVLDFGGALGSSYYQCRGVLAGAVRSLQWNIVEQAQFVKIGQAEFQSSELAFHETVEACFASQQVNVVLLSCVLPYLEKPFEVLGDILKKKPAYVILDRMPMLAQGSRDRLTVQRVPAEIYGQEVHYPAWFFHTKGIDDCMAAHGYGQLMSLVSEVTTDYQLQGQRAIGMTMIHRLNDGGRDDV